MPKNEREEMALAPATRLKGFNADGLKVDVHFFGIGIPLLGCSLLEN